MSFSSQELPSEIGLLRRDVLLIHNTWVELASRDVTRVESPDHKRYFYVTFDLWQSHLDYCYGVAVLLREKLLEPAMAIARSAYETSVYLVYVIKAGESKIRNALLFFARNLLDAKDFYDLPQTERPNVERSLAALPDDIVREAEGYAHPTRGSQRREWSGRSLSEMAKEIGIRGHRKMWYVLSKAVHPALIGLQEERGEGRVVRIAREEAGTEEIELLAGVLPIVLLTARSLE